MIKVKLLLIFLGGYFSLCSQGWELKTEIRLPDADIFSIDQFGNIYAVRGFELQKFNDLGEELYAYANPVLGEIYEIDVLNPMAPYLFFRDANQMIVLDNRLNQKGDLNFSDHHLIDVQLISFSDQENVWFYDQSSDKLHRFNIRTNTSTNQSLTITQIVGAENQPAGMVSSIDRVYLNIPEHGIYIFDATGAFVGIIPLKGVEFFDIEGKQLVGVNDKELLIYNLRDGTYSSRDIDISSIRDVQIHQNMFYILMSDRIRVYRVKA